MHNQILKGSTLILFGILRSAVSAEIESVKELLFSNCCVHFQINSKNRSVTCC